MTVDELAQLTDLAVHGVATVPDGDWGEQAGTLEWSRRATLEHLIDCLFSFALQVAARAQGGFLPFGELRALPEATPADLRDGLRGVGDLLVAVVLASPPDLTAGDGVSALALDDWCARAGYEVALHAHDMLQVEGGSGRCSTTGLNFDRPDQGIWEIRGDPEHFTASKVLCWVAVDRGADLAQERDDTERGSRWRKEADRMKAEICEKGVDGRGRFRQHYGNEELDASLLLLPIMGFLPADDQRVRATVLAIADELTEDGLVLRYRVDTTDSGFEGKEGTFTICSFWLVSALAMIGELERSRTLCKKLLSFAGPLLLYAEEIDVSTGEHLGNFPQAFTHLALIDAVSRLIEAEGAA